MELQIRQSGDTYSVIFKNVILMRIEHEDGRFYIMEGNFVKLKHYGATEAHDLDFIKDRKYHDTLEAATQAAHEIMQDYINFFR